MVTIEANGDVAPYRDRQMAVLRRRQRMDWLDLSRPEHELLQPLPIGTFRIERAITRQAQTTLALIKGFERRGAVYASPRQSRI